MLSLDVVNSAAAPWIVTGVAIAYGLYVTLKMKDGGSSGRVNKTVKLDSAKVVDSVDIEDIKDKAVFCRCWKSKKFPYCDGSHTKHNEGCGDNVGPLIVKRSG